MSATTVTDPSAFKEGSLGLQVVLCVVTLGLYAIYWFYNVNSQLAAGTDADFDPAIRTLITIIPIIGLWGMWQTANDAEAVTNQSGGLLFVLFLVFGPISWYFIQTGINETARSA